MKTGLVLSSTPKYGRQRGPDSKAQMAARRHELLKADDAGAAHPSSADTAVSVAELLHRRDIVLFCLCVVFFHFANAAMLPQVGAKIDMLNNSTVRQLLTTTLGDRCLRSLLLNPLPPRTTCGT